jgi:hypothetical protein
MEIIFLYICFILIFIIFAINSTVNTRSLITSSIVNEKTKGVQIVSSSRGIKKALLIGCNYPRTSYSLQGCINDVLNVREFLILRGYTDIELLCDDGSTTSLPTSTNIISKMTSTITNMKSGDTYFIWYSGHGAQLKNKKADGGYDECWCPPDTVRSGKYLRDDTLNGIIKKASNGTTIFIGSDSCHSGTVFDLRYMLQDSSGANKNKTLRIAEEVRGRNKISKQRQTTEESRFIVSEESKRIAITRKLLRSGVVIPKAVSNMVVIQDSKFASTSSTVVTLSGCQDYSTSADARENGENQGAMTWAFLKAFDETKSLSDNLFNIRYCLKTARYTQVPQLAFGILIDPATPIGNII